MHPMQMFTRYVDALGRDDKMGTRRGLILVNIAGPVRGISFHSTQPLFCSGGDDYKIKVWK